MDGDKGSVKVKTFTIDKEKCLAINDKWDCRKCAELIALPFDLAMACGGEMYIVEDEDFTKSYGKERSDKASLEKAVRECPERALSWN